ncbi:uncharacterized protein LOC120010948 [Tripterygium wilfordii]|uniref:uncharacterized protein LOC120010948 n=1 Tax=Tripterygium wilfordii TaxID=458696 RepID=UPI0018F845ED|nr:uncharacterized protein LOC120010948 [Tripterygium wilfordii]
MSAAVCGSKRSFFDELPSPSSPPSASKKLRRCSSSSPPPIRLSPPSLVHQLRSVFPLMEPQLLQKVMDECGNDLDATVKRLCELGLGSSDEMLGSAAESDATLEKGKFADAGDLAASVNNLPVDGAGWVDLFVREMQSATSLDDARARTSSLLKILEKSICQKAGEAVAQSFQKEGCMLKEQIEGVIRENTILKRAVAIQHERQKEFEDRNKEVQHLKQLVSEYQEQLRKLEVNNYALMMRLRQSQQSSPIIGRFNPDVF